MLLLQGQDAADVARDVSHAPVMLAENGQVLLERIPKRAFGVGKAAERRQRHGEVVGQIRHRQRAWAQHLPTDGKGLSLHRLSLGIPVHGAEQRRVVVHQGDSPRMVALARITEDGEGLPIQFARPFQVVAFDGVPWQGLLD